MTLNKVRLRPLQKAMRLFLFCVLFPFVGCLAVAAEGLPVDDIVSRMTAEAIFSLEPKEAPAYFKDLCPLTTKGAGKYLWVYENAHPGNNMSWLRIEFQPGAEGRSNWELLQSQLALPLSTSAFPDVYGVLKDRIAEKLGAPKIRDDSRENRVAEWSLGAFRAVVLRQGHFDDPYLKASRDMVLLESVIMQGDD